MDTSGNEHSLEAYLRRQRTEVLEAILRADAEGWEEYTLDTILLICKVLAERRPPTENLKEKFRELMRMIREERKDL